MHFFRVSLFSILFVALSFLKATAAGSYAVWATGANFNGQLGDGTTTSRITPVQVASGVATVSAGYQHTLYVKTDGTLWAMGYNAYGQLGDGTTTNRITPVQVASGVATVATGLDHSLYLKTDGTLWTMGANYNGQLGDGTTTNRSTPVQVASGVATVSAGYYHSLYVKTDGTLWSTGPNFFGQLGDGTLTQRSTPVQVASGVATVSAGYYHSLYVKTDGTLWAMGYNAYGQLGDGTTTDRSTPVQVASGVATVEAGGDHSLYLKTDGTLWSTGTNFYGQLGDGTTTDRSTPVQVASGVATVSAGYQHTLYVKTDGTLWTMGYNAYGQLGDGTTTNRITPVQVASGVATVSAGIFHSMYLITDVTTPGAPTGVSGVGGNAQATVTFTAPGDNGGAAITGYTVTSSPAGGTDSNAGSTSLSHVITGLTNGTAYTFTVTATNSVGTSSASSASSSVIPVTVPGAPTALSGVSGNAQAVVSFTAPTSNGGATITSYTITATPVSGGSAVTATGSSSPITVTGLTNGTAYTFTVTATNSVGTSSASSASSSVIPVTVPGAPTALSGVSGNAQATVTFTAPVSNGGAAITGYTVTSNPAGGTDSNAGSTSLSHVITGLTNGTAYTFTVTATNSVGTSSASSASSSVTPILPVAITTQPINLTVAQGYPASFTVAASGTVPLTYQWLKNGIAISGATSATYTIATVATTDAGNYAVTITNAAGSVTSSAATLTVQAFNVLTANQNVIDGKSTAFMTGVSLGSTQWQISTDAGVTWTNLTNNSTYDGVTTNVLEILKVTTAMSKNRYRYQVTINNQITTSTAAVITVGTAFLLLPVGVQVDASGNLYVSDAAGQTVRKISSDFKISTLTGNALSQGSTDGVAGNAKLNEPTGLVLNADNSLLLADTSNAALRQISTVGTVTTFAGTSGSKGSTDATGTAARFSAPVGLTRDGSGNYYVADQTNHTIRKISASGVVTTLAGTAGQSGSVDGTGVAARLNLPTGITCNAQGDLYVSDLGSHLIRKITAAGVVTTLAGQAGASGSSDGSGTAALFFKPSGLAIDSAGNLYVADLGNSTLRKISASGVVSTLAGLPTIDGLMDGTGSNAWFAEPQGLTLDSAGNIYVADTANAVLRKVTPEGLVTTLALAGTAPLISTQPVSITISSGGTATFSVLAIGDAPLSYQWKKDGADLSGMVTTSYSVSPVTTFYAGNYTVAVTNAYGTTLSNTATLTVNGSPPATVNPPPATSGGGGGGGAVSPWFIGALGLLLLVRRTRRRE